MEPPREVKLMVGDELRIYVEVAGQPGEKFSFQWSCNGKNLPYVTSNVLYQKQVKLEDQGSYFCRIRSEQGGSSLTDGTQVIGEQGRSWVRDTMERFVCRRRLMSKTKRRRQFYSYLQ